MKRSHAVTILVTIMVLVLGAVLLVVDRVETNRENSRERFARVEVGQSRAEVDDILGRPDPTVQDLATSSACVVYIKAHEEVDPFVELCFDSAGTLARVTPLQPKDRGDRTP